MAFQILLAETRFILFHPISKVQKLFLPLPCIWNTQQKTRILLSDLLILYLYAKTKVGKTRNMRRVGKQ